MTKAKRPKPAVSAVSQDVEPATMRFIAAALLVGAVLAIVSPNVPNQAQSVDITVAWIGVVGVAAALVLVADQRTAGAPSRVGVAWSAFLAWALVSALVSGRIWAAFVGEPTNMLGLFALLAVTTLGIAATRHGAQTRSLLERYAWIVVFAELCWVTYGQVIGPALSAGTFFNSTYLGEGLLLLLPWCAPTPGVKRVESGARYATLGFALVVLIVTRSRAATALFVLWAFWLLAARVHARKGVKIAFGLGIVIIGALLVTLVTPTFFADAGEALFGGRIVLWVHEGLRAVMARPILGWGLDGFAVAKAAVGTPAMAAAGHTTMVMPGAMDPHNLLIWVAVSTGLVGVALFGWFVVEVIRVWRESSRAGSDVAMPAWALASCLAVGMTAPLTLHVWPLIAVVLGVSLWRPSTSRPLTKGTARRSLPAAQSWQRTATVVFSAVALTSTLLALNAGTRASLEITGDGSTESQAARSVTASSIWMLDAYVAYLSSLHTAWAAEAVPTYTLERTDLAAIKKAVSLDRRYPVYALEHARTVRFYQEPAEVVDAAYAEAFRRYPIYPLAHAEYAVYLASTGRIDEARQHLATAMLVDDEAPDRLQAIEQAESLIAASGG